MSSFVSVKAGAAAGIMWVQVLLVVAFIFVLLDMF
jgi:hypothetical protein